MTLVTGRDTRASTCLWCGRPVPEIGTGRRRRYCRQSCRQRAYEQRSSARRAGLPEDSVVLTAAEVEALADRAFRVRCAAEDVATAVAEGAAADELTVLCAELLELARDAERLR
ncbi:hypothetical protein [Rhodococcus rhodochrous]|uniref:Uncharacterized protein n=1 Tax=Rhodococcus rhodochrous J45 TaxID=935266 RepID=A0A562E4P2_RHORH|nr:hypothetical protein [Rhodococcus rhodochrous]TWH16737.1 hypothetical protein L618_002000000210 [Rhodococcus rhodochrous J45]